MIKESREDEDEELNACFDVKHDVALAVATVSMRWQSA